MLIDNNNNLKNLGNFKNYRKYKTRYENNIYHKKPTFQYLALLSKKTQ